MNKEEREERVNTSMVFPPQLTKYKSFDDDATNLISDTNFLDVFGKTHRITPAENKKMDRDYLSLVVTDVSTDSVRFFCYEMTNGSFYIFDSVDRSIQIVSMSLTVFAMIFLAKR